MSTEVAQNTDLNPVRFSFGKNWESFLKRVDRERIERAIQSLQKIFGLENLKNRKFLDVGCGSGLFSLAAAQLGASVHSFDFDEGSIRATQQLRSRELPHANWTVEQGSVLDSEYLTNLGIFDVVYSWGVLHHTGALWNSVGKVLPLVASGGQLCIALYNDQGNRSHFWWWVKRIYNVLPRTFKFFYVLPFYIAFAGAALLKSLCRGNGIRAWWQYQTRRGMSRWHDVVDWVGGFPFEVASPQKVIEFVSAKGFTLVRQTTTTGLGCNEFVFRRRI